MRKEERLKEIKRIVKWLTEQEIVKQVVLSGGDTSTPLIVLLKDEDKE
ncbi:hypothetical protein [Gallibacterium anatis]|nr:hypothetical protein [Gallibacterium anatis]